MGVIWDDKAFEELYFWVETDKKTVKRIYKLVLDIQRNGLAQGIGKPEALRHRKGWSRRIDEKNRLLYDMNEQGQIEILSCKGHYED